MFVLGGEILDERTAHGVDGRCGQLFALETGVNVPRRQQAAGRALHIALEAGDLACKEDVGVLLEAEPCAQHPGCVEEGVAVHDAVPDKLGVLEAGYHAEHPLLLAPFQVCLETHDVIQGPLLIFGPELNVGPGAVAGAGVDEAHRAQGAEPHGVGTPGGHDLDGHTALVDRDGIGLLAVGIGVGLCALLCARVELMERSSLCRGQRGVECLVLGLVEGTVEVVGLAPVVTGGGKHLLIVEALRRHDGGHGVVEVEALIAGQAADLVRQRTVRQGAGGHEDGGALVDVLHPLPVNGDVRLSLHHPGDFGAEGVAVHGQRTARGHAGRLGGVQELTAHPAHLLFQQAGGGVQTLGFQAVGADELREALALVGRGEVSGLLLVELHLYAFARQPEGRFAACQTGT